MASLLDLLGLGPSQPSYDYKGIASDAADEFANSDSVNNFINMMYQARYGVNSEDKDRLIQGGQIPGAPEHYASGSEQDRYLGDRAGAGYLSANHWGSTIPYMIGSGLREGGQGLNSLIHGGPLYTNEPQPTEEAGGFNIPTFMTGYNAAKQGAQDPTDQFGTKMPGMSGFANLFGF